MEKIIFDKHYLTIFADEEEKEIHLRWKAFANSDELRESLNFALEYVKVHHIKRWLGNLRNMSVIKEADRSWINNEWFPQLANTGLNKMAIIISLDYFNQSAVNRIMDKAEPIIPFETEYFNDMEKAREWLNK